MVLVGEFEGLVDAVDVFGPEEVEVRLLGADDDKRPICGFHSDCVAEADCGLFDAIGAGFAHTVEEEDCGGGGFEFGSGSVYDEVVAIDAVVDESGGHGDIIALDDTNFDKLRRLIPVPISKEIALKQP